MKLIISIFIIISIFSILINGCQKDYECGIYPYAACNDKLNLGFGLAYNSNNNKLIISGKYNSSDSGPFGYPYVLELGVNNGEQSSELETLNRINGEILAGSGFTTFFRIYQYAPIHNYIYIQYYQAGSNIYGMFDVESGIARQILNVWGIPFTIGINKEETKTVVGGYGISLINTIPKVKSDFDNATVLYKDQITSGIILDGNDIYISTYDGKLLLGSTDCLNCSKDQLKEIVTDIDAQFITGFLMVNDMLYFSFSGGIKGYSKQGVNSSAVQLTTDDVTAMTTDGNYIYYITFGEIKSVKAISNSNNEQQSPKLVYHSTPNHQCQCAVGFSGDNCSICNGTILWNNGLPLCTEINDDGYVETCYTNQDCSQDNQFVFCNYQAKCLCLPGFTSNKNDCYCNGEVIWNFGYPSCVNTTSSTTTTISPI